MVEFTAILLLFHSNHSDFTGFFWKTKQTKNRRTFRVQIDCQVLEDVHVRRVGYGAHARSQALLVDVVNRLRSHVQHESVSQRNVVSHARFRNHLEFAAKFRQKGDGCSTL